jgi:two-component system, NarL family, nitrate/nitrite response regulator NarL
MRRSLQESLAAEPGISIAGEAGDMHAALRLAENDISVAIVDSAVAPLASTAAQEALKALARRAPTVVTGMGDPSLYAAPYLAAGATGYWAKYDELATLVAMLRSAAAPRRQAA